MLFSVPISSKETKVDTPLDCKSIRSFYFFDRYGKTKMFLQDGNLDFRDDVTIIIDGKTICERLNILPFMHSQTPNVSFFGCANDWRRISIPCLKNTDLSEIKIIAETNYTELDFEVVFEYSDVEVEEEKFTHIESFAILPTPRSLGDFIPENNGILIRVFDGEEVQLTTHEDADTIFCMQLSLIDDYNKANIETKEGFEILFRTEYYNQHSVYPQDYQIPYPSYKISIADRNEVIPKGMPLDLISVSSGVSWKEAQYKLNDGLSKHPKISFDLGYSPSFIGGMMPFLILYLAHDCKF